MRARAVVLDGILPPDRSPVPETPFAAERALDPWVDDPVIVAFVLQQPFAQQLLDPPQRSDRVLRGQGG